MTRSVVEPFSNVHEYIVYFQEFPQIFFETLDGGEESNEVTTVYPGGGGHHRKISGPSAIGQVTVAKSRQPVTDSPIEAWSRQWQRGIRQPLTLVKEGVNAAGVPTGEKIIYRNCARVTVTYPTVQKGGAEAAQLQVVVEPEDIA